MRKKKLFIFLGIIAVIIVIYFSVTTTIPFGNDVDLSEIKSADVFYIGDWSKVENKSEIQDLINSIRSIRYLKSYDLTSLCQTPDAFVYLWDDDGNIIERLELYGEVAIYKSKFYGIVPFTTYGRFQKLCNEYAK